MQEVDSMDSKMLDLGFVWVFLRHLGYNIESCRIRDGGYLIVNMDSVKWQKNNLSYTSALLSWCNFPNPKSRRDALHH